jgi:hypothetical protein
MPELTDYVKPDGKIDIKVVGEMYGLIQSAKLWHKELT